MYIIYSHNLLGRSASLARRSLCDAERLYMYTAEGTSTGGPTTGLLARCQNGCFKN